MTTFNQKGLSLLEVMIGLAIIAMISIAIFQATQTSFKLVETTTREDQDRLNIYTALGLLEMDFSQIYSPLYYSEKFNLQQLNPKARQQRGGTGRQQQQGQDPPPQQDPKRMEIMRIIEQIIDLRYRNNKRFYLPNESGIPIPRFITPTPDHFEFFTMSNRRRVANSRESQYAWVSYSLEPPSPEDVQRMREESDGGQVNPGKVFVRRFSAVDPFGDDDFETNNNQRIVRGQVLLEKVDKLEFSFWDFRTQKFTPLRDVYDGLGKIEAMKIEITYRNIYNQVQIVERIFRPLWPINNFQSQMAPPRPRSPRPGQRIQR